MFNIQGLYLAFRKRKVFKKIRKTHSNSLSDNLEDEAAEKLFRGFLGCMEIMLLFDSNYRRNIEGFQGTYLFRTKDSGANVLAQFDKGQMRTMEDVLEEDSPEADVTVTFKNGRAMINFLFNPIARIGEDLTDERIGVDRPHTFDIMESLRRNEVNFTGNLNYLYKFAFMANHLLLGAEKLLGLPE
jgi:hypothetical protein